MTYLDELVVASIKSLDEYYQTTRPIEISLEGLSGRIVYGEKPLDLLKSFNQNTERMATFREVAETRLKSYQHLFRNSRAIQALILSSLTPSITGPLCNDLIKEARADILDQFEKNSQIHDIWKVRLTTATSMVRVRDEVQEYILFCDNNPNLKNENLTSALEGKISDGGIIFGSESDKKNAYAKLHYKEYLAAKGGNFNGIRWLEHPVFRAAFNNHELMQSYVLAMQVLAISDIYHQGIHSGWVPGEMKEGYGRFLSLGYKGEAFYPVNNSTIGHAALIVLRNP